MLLRIRSDVEKNHFDRNSSPTGGHMKLHRHVALLEVSDSKIIDALAAMPDWTQQYLHHVSDTVVVVQVDQVETIAAKLRDLGYLPRVIEK